VDEEDEEVESEDEDEDTSLFEERTEEQRLAAEAAWEAKLRAKPAAPAPEPKKKATAAIDFAALAAAKAKKAAAAAKKAPAAKAPAAAPQAEDMSVKPAVAAGEGDLPQGEEGAEWEALADGLIRQERDVKSAKRGAVQSGERVTQTGPWRADPTGRVRMPVKGPRGVFGWVSLDERRCENAMGEYGTLLFEFIGEPAAAPEVHATPAPAPPSSAAKAKVKGEAKAPVKEAKAPVKAVKASAPATGPAELDDLLDEWGVSDNDAPSSGGESEAADEAADEAVDGAADDEEANIAPASVSVLDAPQGGNKPSTAAATKAPAPKEAAIEASQLTETEKALRAIRKKIRELDDLETKGNLTEAQQQKLAGRDDLRQKEASLEAEVKREKKKAKEAAKIEAGGVVRKRPKQKKGAAGKEAPAAKAKSSGSIGPLLVVGVVVAVGACAVTLFFNQ